MVSRAKYINYFDSYHVALDNNQLNASQLYLALAKSTPGWINSLMFLRDKIGALMTIRPVGSLGQSAYKDKLIIKVGEKCDAFTEWYLTDDEIVVDEDDSHLNFRLSVHKTIEESKEKVVLSMVVTVNNAIGKMYLSLILPFHKIVMKAYLDRAKKNRYM